MKVFGFAGYSSAGKTTLIEALIRLFVARGLRVSLIKHAHHGFDIDRPGKDSFRHRTAGAAEVMLVCEQRWAIMHELRDEPEPDLERQLAHLAPCDLVLIEGYKSNAVPKIEVHRPSNGKPCIWPENPSIVAVASDVPAEGPLPWLDLNDHAAIAAFVLKAVDLE
jgi:molybdopterin-guanine dinucleotide biosynthesis adapter protein